MVLEKKAMKFGVLFYEFFPTQKCLVTSSAKSLLALSVSYGSN